MYLETPTHYLLGIVLYYLRHMYNMNMQSDSDWSRTEENTMI